MRKYLIFTLPILSVIVTSFFYLSYDTTGSEYSQIDGFVFLIPVVINILFGVFSFISLLVKYSLKKEKNDKRIVMKQAFVLIVSVLLSFVFIEVIENLKH